MRGIRRTATVLFTDLVGSTAMLGRLAPAEAEAVRVRHFGALRDALAVHRGREIKTLGDGLMAAFDSVGDALASAVTMQRAVERQSRAHPGLGIAMRIGVSAGDVTDQDGDYFGQPVVEASRLCTEAGAGGILVGEIVRILAGPSSMHRMVPVGELLLKGLTSPVIAWRVDWDAEEECTLRVALADDSALLRQGIALALESEGIDVVVQVADAEALLKQLAGSRPHVVVLDVRMPPTHTTEGLEAAALIRREHPEIGVLVLSASVNPGAARRLLQNATDGIGYLLKERIADLSELTAAIRTVASGGSAIDPEVLTQLAS